MSEPEERKPATIRMGDATPPAETDWNAVYEAQQAEGDAPPGGFLNNQLAKIGCGCAMPALFLLGTCSSMTAQRAYGGGSQAMMIGELTGGVVAGILLIWFPIFLFWLRDQSKWLIAGSFVLIAGILTVLGLSKIGTGFKAMTEDVSAISDVKFDKEGVPILPPGMSAKGPMSKLMVDMANEQGAIRKELDAEFGKLGIEDMMIANRVVRKPELVKNCARITDADETIEALRLRNKELIKSGPERIEKLDLSYSVKAEMKRGALTNLDGNMNAINAQYDLQLKLLGPIHRTCLILSKRNWTAQGETFLFNNDADLKAFNNAMGEIEAANAEITAVVQKQITKVRSGQEKIKADIKPRF
jgi:hypothetical protein